MKKVVLKLDVHDGKAKQKAMKIVSGLSGVEAISMDMKDKKLTITGDVDPVNVVSKLRKLCHTEILTVGPAKPVPKKPDDSSKDGVAGACKPYGYPHPPIPTYYYITSPEQAPNTCVIC